MTCSFDLLSQKVYDLFSHDKYAQLCNLSLEYLNCNGNIKLKDLTEQHGEKASIKVQLNTKPGMLYVLEIQGKTSSSAEIFVERLENGCSLIKKSYKFNTDEKKYCKKYLCTGYESFMIHFRARSPKTLVGICLDEQDNNDVYIRHFSVTKLDSCDSNITDSSTQQTCTDSTSDSCSYTRIKLEPYPECPTHGHDCPTSDKAEYADPYICPIHGINCPTFQ